MYKYFCSFLFCVFLFPNSFFAQKKDKPKPGEGVSAFLRRHNRPPQAYHEAFIKLNKSKLGKDETLLKDVFYVLPPLKKHLTETLNKKIWSIEEPLFGPSYKNVQIRSHRLSNACFYVVSGHGGPDPGAIGKANGHELHEDEYAYDIALRLARCLMEEGAEVRIIIQDEKDGIRDVHYLENSKSETCMGDPIPLDQTARLRQRCDKINSFYRKERKKYAYCRAIFIHVDSRGKGEQTDVYFYHTPNSTKGKHLATNMKDKFEARYGRHQPNRGFRGTVSERNLYVMRNSNPVAVFVELGNIQNTFDLRRLLYSGNRQALARWLCDGFLQDFR